MSRTESHPDIEVRFFHGKHNDPRIMGKKQVYGLGSYISGWTPDTLEFLYFTLANNSHEDIAVCGFSFRQNGQEAEIGELDLPGGILDNYVLAPGEELAVGFLRDLITKVLRDRFFLSSPFRFSFTFHLAGRGRVESRPQSLDLNYPRGPLGDAQLIPYAGFLERRARIFAEETARIAAWHGGLEKYASLHKELGAHKMRDEYGNYFWRFREWMPEAEDLWLTTDYLKFQRHANHKFNRISPEGLWELDLYDDKLGHGTYHELRVSSAKSKGAERRVPAFAMWVCQDENNLDQWCARLWDPCERYEFKHDAERKRHDFPLVYEAHVGMARPSGPPSGGEFGGYAWFKDYMLPRIKADGYNVVQLMGVLEHPLYKSFGYQVSSYFAPCSRFGCPDDFKALVDEAHRLGIMVVLDIPHSHACPNTEQGIAFYDTGRYFFHENKTQWGTMDFDFSVEMARRFLMSNCLYWMEEYHVDGFRFDAVGNMIYVDHGLDDDFSHEGRCFYAPGGGSRVDDNGVLYLGLVNTLVHEYLPHGITIAEEFSGMPGMTSSPAEAGLGFDYRLAMGIPDFWGKFIKEGREIGQMWHEVTVHRSYERTISYVECHDQCINGKDAMIWRIIGPEMYEKMSTHTDSWKVSRGLALHKMMRLITLGAAGHGYLNFMGNEFGHPEWLDADTNAHRHWHLAERDDLKYKGLGLFDRGMLSLLTVRYANELKARPRFRFINEENRLLAFERGRLLFIFNFHEMRAEEGQRIFVTPGKYVEVLSSDEKAFCGHGNLAIKEPPTAHFSDSGSGVLEQSITVYVPPMVGLVLFRE